ncbi:hypothetical protein [Rhodobium gokarnense]|uniref:Uncharacterized protein n=1 Tax=Rhodobium gokarnense TaxID=364296 RepID=A0ABT3HHG0_9HYPH|nr:hypothetical protein [Rhodobium gokarnense]MCW2309691.1 hypothetical protein [Rhodobium gokarnense]
MQMTTRTRRTAGTHCDRIIEGVRYRLCAAIAEETAKTNRLCDDLASHHRRLSQDQSPEARCKAEETPDAKAAGLRPFFAFIQDLEGSPIIDEALAVDRILDTEQKCVDRILQGGCYGPVSRVIFADIGSGQAFDATKAIARLVADQIDAAEENRDFAIRFVEGHLPFVWDGEKWVRVSAAGDWTRPYQRGDIIFPTKERV